jgi:CRP/FNR family transcriptional regulator, cyclic AMP receptor protein
MSIIKMPPQEAPWIQPFLSFCHRRRHAKGAEILHQGDHAQVLHYLIEGSVVAFIEDNDGREIILAYLNKGEFVGEMGLFLPEPRRSVMVRARTDCQVAEITYVRLEQLFEAELRNYMREILYALGGQLARRLLNTSNKVGHLAFLDVTGRIARTLLDLCKQPDAMTHPDGMQIRITRQEIGRIVGCSREMAGRVLKNLEDTGLITVKGKTIVVFGTR